MPNATDSEYNYYSANFLKCMHNNRTELLYCTATKNFPFSFVFTDLQLTVEPKM